MNLAMKVDSKYPSGNMASSVELASHSSLLSTVSPIGAGTYLGDCSDDDDVRYRQTLSAALDRGITLIDTAINYRAQRSERVIGQVLAQRTGSRPGVQPALVCTKGGYVPLDGTPPANKQEYRKYLEQEYIEPGLIAASDLVAGGHCIAPRFLQNQIARSRSNLGVETIDLYYLHNPEQQLDAVPKEEFELRLREAFAALEAAAANNEIREYGCATWHGLRVSPDAPNHLNLETLVRLARDAGGTTHHFTTIQLPINLAMGEAIRLKNQTVDGTPCTVLEAAHALGVSVITSAPLMHGQLTRDLPEQLHATFPTAKTDAQRAIMFVRQLPGVSSVLVGMRSLEHLAEVTEIFS